MGVRRAKLPVHVVRRAEGRMVHHILLKLHTRKRHLCRVHKERWATRYHRARKICVLFTDDC